MSRIWPFRRVSDSPAFPPASISVDGHDLTLVVDGAARLAHILAIISGAGRSLRLFYYIFEDDPAGRDVLGALLAARARGVEVTLLIDGFGSSALPDNFFAPLIDAGGRMARFIPHKGRRYLLRNHQKMLIADERVALIGGANIAEDYFRDTETQDHWHDLMLEISGPKVENLAVYFDALNGWVGSQKQRIRRLQGILAATSEHSGALRWVMGGPFERLNPLARALRSDLDAATEVSMVEAYFAPEFTFLRRLGRIARRGRLRLVTAAKSDNTTTIGAARHCYGLLMRRGASIFEYTRTRLHMKLIVADDIVYIGSANFDTRSIFINVELMLRIEDAAFAARVRALFDEQLESCRRIDRVWLKQASGPFRRLRWFLAYFLFSTLDYTITRRFNIGPDRKRWRRPVAPAAHD